MTSYIGGAAAAVIVSYLPIEENSVKLAVGMAVGELVNGLVRNLSNIGPLSNYFTWGKSYVTICDTDDKEEENPIYKKMEEYILYKWISNIKKCDLIADKGEISYSLKNSSMKRDLVDTYNNHQITIKVNQTKVTDDKKDTSDSTNKLKSNNNIIIESKTANVDLLKEYVDNISRLQKEHRKVLKIYRPIYESKKENTRWDTIKVKTNKTMENTIVSEEVQLEVFEDVNWFMNNEAWYAKKGIDYKRGYILYGVPGTGKTSIIKAIANRYSLPIFSIDLGNIKSNDELTRLTNKINYLVEDKNYILAMEDVDRCKLFKDRGYYGGGGERTKVSMSCFLNCLDGIVETHGRITILTANNFTILKSKSALIRPGRIDKCVEIGCCDRDQMKRLIQNFYDKEIDIEDIRVKNNVTPAQLIKFMQSASDDIEETLQFIDDTNPMKYQDFTVSVKKRIVNRKKMTALDRKKYKVSTEKKRLTMLKNSINRCEKNIEKYKLQINKKELDIKHVEKEYEEMKKKDEEKKKKAAEREKAKKEKAASKAKKTPKKKTTKKKKESVTFEDTPPKPVKKLTVKSTKKRSSKKKKLDPSMIPFDSLPPEPVDDGPMFISSYDVVENDLSFE